MSRCPVVSKVASRALCAAVRFVMGSAVAWPLSAIAAPCRGTFLSVQRFLFALDTADVPAGTQRLSGIPVASESVETAHARGRHTILALRRGSDLEDPQFERVPLTRFARRENDTLVKLITLSLGSGSGVSVIADQPLPNPYGDFVAAGAFHLGQSLLKSNGTYGLVRGIESSPSYDALFEISLDERKAEQGTLLVSDGVLVGLNGCTAAL
jgi:hypothetical protein